MALKVQSLRDTIETSRRMIEEDMLDYRVLTHDITAGDKRYLLEIGKTTSTIGQYNQLLQQFALYALICLTGLSIIIDLIYPYIAKAAFKYRTQQNPSPQVSL